MPIPDTTCTISFDGTGGGTYTIGCEYVSDINQSLVNTGNSNIYLYPNGSPLTDSTYPYISISPGHYARLYSSYNNYQYITNVTNVRFNILGNVYREKVFIDSFLSILIAFFVIVRIFKK